MNTNAQDNMYKRTQLEARYFLGKDETIRSTAKHFGVSKSTVHNDLTRHLKYLADTELLTAVQEKLKTNKQEAWYKAAVASLKQYDKEYNA